MEKKDATLGNLYLNGKGRRPHSDRKILGFSEAKIERLARWLPWFGRWIAHTVRTALAEEKHRHSLARNDGA